MVAVVVDVVPAAVVIDGRAPAKVAVDVVTDEVFFCIGDK